MRDENVESNVVSNIVARAHYLATQMIFQANHREDKEPGDPKVGGHVSASASALHIMGALHLMAKSGFDHIANKPHASPTDHAYNYLLNLFLKEDLSRYSQSESDAVMSTLRAFSQNGEPVFQSYHSSLDPDRHNFFPSGSVGIPPVMAGYLALAYKLAAAHDYNIPKAHFWALCGDSEFREGSIYEAIPDFAERELNNLTWIIDYNRQSLDGHRISNQNVMSGNDSYRLEQTLVANGWHVIQIRHGKQRLSIFARPGGDKLKNFFENELEDLEFQALLLLDSPQAVRDQLGKKDSIRKMVASLSDADVNHLLRDLGGHDIFALRDAMLESKKSKHKPTLIIAHTIKGWGLKLAASPSNHSALPDEDEMLELQTKQGLPKNVLFAPFAPNTPESKFLAARGESLYKEILEQHQIRQKNMNGVLEKLQAKGELPISFEINTKLVSYPHTQWMMGQIAAKITRISNTAPKNEKDEALKLPAQLVVSMAPDVGTSTNLNSVMDGKIFGSLISTDFEKELGVKVDKNVDLIPGTETSDRYIRFEIAEGNAVSCVGSFGKMGDIIGVPFLPVMTVYDFFIKRALDQHFYNLYWKSSFILIGTPSGVTLSFEGAQHGWKSDIQIPNQVTWEPYFCLEMDWILAETMRLHFSQNNQERMGVLIRGVTRGVEQKNLLKLLKRQKRFKKDLSESTLLCRQEFPVAGAASEQELEPTDDARILDTLRSEVLSGGYRLIDYSGYGGYEPGDNVVHIFAMGALTTEAIEASEALLSKGIFANIFVITSTDLLIGNLAHKNNYSHLRQNLGINANLYMKQILHNSELTSLAGRRIPIVSVHDGEPGLLDNIGSIIGVPHVCLAVRKHSKCGRPSDIYKYHHLDSASIVEGVEEVLHTTAAEEVFIRPVSN